MTPDWRLWDDGKKRALLERLRTEAWRAKRARWAEHIYPWQRPHEHPAGWDGPCDDTCKSRPTAEVPAQGMWLMLGGRGTGKTDGCATYMDEHAMGPPCDPRAPGGHRMLIVAPTLGDAAESCVLGVSGLRAHNPNVELKSTPGGTKAVWPNGAEARLMGAYTPEDVERLRAAGNRCLIWLEEVAAMRRLDDALEHTAYGLRVGPRPHYIGSTTPKPRPKIKELRDAETTIVTRGKTSAAIHLAQAVRDALMKKYAGTRKGRQELDGVLFEDVEGALWTTQRIDRDRVKTAPPGIRIVVSIDPAVSNTEESDETGILVVGADPAKEHGYVLDDLSGHYAPEEWAAIAVEACKRWDADYIVGERNQGGDMVKATIRAYDRTARYRDVTATKGKRLRAEPIAVLAEQGRIHHVGTFPELEDQQVTWVPGEDGSKSDSPDRLDAMVHGLTDLMITPTSTSNFSAA